LAFLSFASGNPGVHVNRRRSRKQLKADLWNLEEHAVEEFQLSLLSSCSSLFMRRIGNKN